jgi:RHS repeat-associated protein
MGEGNLLYIRFLCVSCYPFGMEQQGLDYINPTLLDEEDKNKYLFNGKELDEKTNLYEYGFRYYDAQLARVACTGPYDGVVCYTIALSFCGEQPDK